jgi:hypothetical protein
LLAELEAKIEGSKEQIDYLESEFTAFVEANSTGVAREEDPQTGEWVFRFGQDAFFCGKSCPRT